MNWKVFPLFIIILSIIIIPINAQEINSIEKATQKSVKVIINEKGNIHVKHVVKSSDSLQKMKLIEGTIENLIIINEEGKQFDAVVDANNSIIILPSKIDSVVEYDLENVLFQERNFWKLEFLYLEKTTFIIPEELDLIFVNNRPVYLDEKKRFYMSRMSNDFGIFI